MKMKKEELAIDILRDLNEIFTNKEIAEMIGFNEYYLNGIINGKRKIGDKLIKTLTDLSYNEKKTKTKYFEKNIVLTKI